MTGCRCEGYDGLPVSDSNDHGLDSHGRHLPKQASGPEHLVIRVRGHDDESPRSPLAQSGELGQATRAEPSSLIGSRVLVVDD